MNKKEEAKKMLVLSKEEVVNTFGGYAPPDKRLDDILNPPTVPSEPKPFDPVCW